ncbi:MAG TPA: SDR family NAD(P)-dependent oxidoreductase [Gemmatimonadales bacterium]
MTGLPGRNALVTGAGRGIGAAVAHALAAAGARVALTSRSPAQIERVAAELRSAGRDAFAITCDVSDPTSIAELARVTGERLGAVDILVNNAGIGFSGPLFRTPLADWDRLMTVNATGAFLCTQAFLPGMVERRWGRIVFVASVAGLTGGKYIAAYAASKHAVIGLARSAAAEVAESGVTVNAVCPGYVDTDMTRESLDRIMEKTGKTREQALAAILATTPQRRLIAPEEVAHAVLSLCDEQARGINGESLVIDGGWLMR